MARKAGLKKGPAKKAAPFHKKSLQTPIPDVPSVKKIRPLPEIHPAGDKESPMPWNAQSFKKHNKGMDNEESGQAARVASAIVENEGDEAAGKAIAIANAQAKRAKLRAPDKPPRKGARREMKGLRQADMMQGMRVSP